MIGVINKKTFVVSNLGDSGFLVIRNAGSWTNEENCNPFILLKSKPQQHAFNTPY